MNYIGELLGAILGVLVLIAGELISIRKILKGDG
jgi:hypothetical protein